MCPKDSEISLNLLPSTDSVRKFWMPSIWKERPVRRIDPLRFPRVRSHFNLLDFPTVLNQHCVLLAKTSISSQSTTRHIVCVTYRQRGFKIWIKFTELNCVCYKLPNYGCSSRLLLTRDVRRCLKMFILELWTPKLLRASQRKLYQLQVAPTVIVCD